MSELTTHKLHQRFIDSLTEQELDGDNKKRLALINEEFRNGYNFIKKYQKSVTIFGSSRAEEGTIHYKVAKRLAGRLAAMKYAIVTGGGPGIMEAANRGARDAGGDSLGLGIKLLHEQKMNDYTTASMTFHYFFTRKVTMSFAAEAFIFFPGGFGTLNEFFETTTLLQTKKIPTLPLILVGRDYWGPLNDFLYKTAYVSHQGIEKEDLGLYSITDDEDEIISLVEKAPIIRGLTFTGEGTSAL